MQFPRTCGAALATILVVSPRAQAAVDEFASFPSPRNEGTILAVSKDTLAVGFPESHGARFESGNVHVYVRSDAGWRRQAVLWPHDGMTGDRFGWSLDLDGDTLVVGAPQPELGTGKAYVFERDGRGWSQRSTLLDATGEPNDLFGFDVALSSDTIAIGQPRNHETDDIAGRVHVFERDALGWLETCTLQGIEQGDEDLFGYSVDTTGDVIVVGACTEVAPDSHARTGAVYSFTRTDSGYRRERVALPPELSGAARFGWSVAASNDALIVGAPWSESAEGCAAGAAFVYVRDLFGGTWTFSEKLATVRPAIGGAFGWSVAIDGNRAIVGSPWDESAGLFAGSAQLFRKHERAWIPEREFFATGERPRFAFGASATIDGDVVLLAAPWEELGAGAAYVFEVDGRRWYESCRLQPSE